MKLPDKLRELRLNNKLTATFVATRLGISKSTLSNYEKGFRTPKAETLIQLAKIYNVSMDCIFDFDTNGDISPNERSIPILVVNEEISDNNIIGYTDLDREYVGKGEYFALYVSDDSINNSSICEGCIVTVKKQGNVNNGDIAVVMNEERKSEIKRIYRTANTMTLIPSSTNPIHSSRKIDLDTSKVTILGKAVEVKIKL